MQQNSVSLISSMGINNAGCGLQILPVLIKEKVGLEIKCSNLRAFSGMPELVHFALLYGFGDKTTNIFVLQLP